MPLYTEERKDIEALWEKLKKYRFANAVKQTYYEAKNTVKDLGISIPPALTRVQESIGWAKTATDALNERVILEGYTDAGLNKIFDDNFLLTEAPKCHLDAFKFGIGFAIVGQGDTDAGEPEVLITIENPSNVAINFDSRKRRVKSAIHIIDQDKIKYGTYFTEEEAISFIISGDSIISLQEDDRLEHGFGRVPVVDFTNQTETGSTKGHSEISEPIISLINSMMRTMLGAEISREFYSAPQRYVLGADVDMFLDADGNMRDALSMLMDRMLILPEGSEPGDKPAVGQFASNSPLPYTELIRLYAQLFSSEAAIPESYLGFNTVNPSSADAIRASEARLIKKAENRIANFRRPWEEVARLALLARDGFIDDSVSTTPSFRDPATPTQSANTDIVIKLIQAGVLAPNSEIVYRKLGFTRQDIAIARADSNATNGSALLRALEGTGEKPEETGV